MQNNEINEKLQEQLFGKRYVGATKASISIPLGQDEGITKWVRKPRNILLMLGPPGCGKTYNMSAIVGESTTKSIRAFNERSFMGKIREGIEKYSNYDFIQEIRRLTDTELFIIDDLGSGSRTDWRDEIIMEAIDWLYSQGTPAIFTSNLNKDEFYESFHPRICSRLFAKENTIVDLNGMEDLRAQGK